jgi:hypothetical protein
MAEPAKQLDDPAPGNPAPVVKPAHGGKGEKPPGRVTDAGSAWPDKDNMRDAGELVKPLPESRWSLLEHKDPGHWVCLERGTSYQVVFEPSFWANIAKKFQPGQTIWLKNDELTVHAILIILDCGRNWATVGEFLCKTMDDLVKSRPPMKMQPRHTVQFAGPIDKWRIVRADNQVIKAGFETQAMAEQYLQDYLRRLGA